MSTPKVFISYSHDSQDHKKWVLDLATRLRNNGIDAIIDQWELRPGDDLPHFMETHLTDSDYVVMVCTENYVEKANKGTGGVGYEKMIITADLLSNIDSNKIIPIIRQFGTSNVPTFIRTKLFLNFSNNNEYEFCFDELVRTFHDAPLFKKPEIGNNPFTTVESNLVERTGDPMREVMEFIVSDFEDGKDFTYYKVLVGSIKMSRVMLDIVIADAESRGYISRDFDGDIVLRPEGKKYAVQYKLVNL
ncbi:TIR domain-containing protein [Cellvibrio sp. KY-GH-1]|uniref:toll/interleukin-1 receptor domain-containing protein n=1 Tax=Cellvibrio sp. KY-GH-1 TaxID=2303332 RepID=UPI001244569C|nr:toll/interleukin-1 receptor domain-containing protein [Cellvibrio sp. KY-GH-1]QEY16325.1 TIR domain-containing protein [Cellvibrio sp. KY-GH-1]